ncbi:MAG: hypothetical protein EOO71_08390 [Myxococcaceae bacterium]|nr:MAG: hypothetical protein EOO71_08390 [Myxococcaceae bacterium]
MRTRTWRRRADSTWAPIPPSAPGSSGCRPNRATCASPTSSLASQHLRKLDEIAEGVGDERELAVDHRQDERLGHQRDPAASELATGRLKLVLERHVLPREPFYLYYPNRQQMPLKLRAFIDFFRERNRAVGERPHSRGNAP